MTAVTPINVFRVLRPASALFNNSVGDLCDIDDVRDELDLANDPTSDRWFSREIRAQSRRAVRYLNRDLAVQTYGEEIWERREFYTRPWRDRSIHAPLQLRAWPVANVASTAKTAPPLTPALGSTPGGSLPARLYYVKASYVTATGETAASIEGSIAVPANALLTVASPAADVNAVATGWRVYVGATSWGETLQATLSPGARFVEPTNGLVAGAALPNHVLVVENFPSPVVGAPFPATPLAEGLDFMVDAEKAQLSRLYLSGYTRAWPYFPVTVQYAAGFAEIPDDVQLAVMRLVAMRYAGKGRDPNLKSESVVGVGQSSYVAGDAQVEIPVDIAALLDGYRSPLVG